MDILDLFENYLKYVSKYLIVYVKIVSHLYKLRTINVKVDS